MARVFYALAALLVVFWFVGWVILHVAGPVIHLALVIALVVVIYQLLTPRRAV